MQKLGVIKNILGGEVVAVDKSGNERVLKVGDSIFEGETIKANGSTKAVIAANDGKEVSLQNGESLSLDKEANALSDNPEIASIQKALLNGANITDLEETAAGGNQGGGNATGDGVSLGAASFAEGGHYSNINENYRNLTDANRAFQTPENSIGGYNDAGTDADTTTPISPATPVTPSTPSTPVTPPTPSTPSTPGVTVTPGTPSPANPPVITPRPGAVEITTSIDPANSEVRESGAGANGEGRRYLVYKLGLSGTPVSPSGETTDLALNFIGGTRGEDYANLIEYSLNNGAAGSWVTLNANNTIPGVNVEDISKVQVRIKVLDDYGQANLDHHNQNEGSRAEIYGVDDNNSPVKNGLTQGVENFGVYKEGVSLSVTPTSSYLLPTTAANRAEGYIIDNDDNLEITSDLSYADGNNYRIKTLDGDDTVTIKANVKGTQINTDDGDDIVNFDKAGIAFGSDNIDEHASINMYEGNDTVNINEAMKLGKAHISLDFYENSTGKDTLNINADVTGLGTTNNSSFYLGGGDDAINIKNATVSGVNIDASKGADTISIDNATIEKTNIFLTHRDKLNEADKVDINDATFIGSSIGVYNSSYNGEMADLNNDQVINVRGKTSFINTGASDSGGLSATHVNINGTDSDKILFTGASSIHGKEINIDHALFSHGGEIGNHVGDQGRNYFSDATVTLSNTQTDDKVGFRFDAGNDTLTFNGNNTFGNGTEGSGAGIDMGGGNNTINFVGKNSAASLILETGDGTDTINIGGETSFGGTFTGSTDGYTFKQRVSISTGSGDDTINIDKGAVLKAATINTGDGNDNVKLNGELQDTPDYWHSTSSIDLGNGDDTLHIGKDAIMGSGTTIKGGAGTDTLDIAGNIDFSKVAGFEKVSLGGSENNVTLNLTINDVLNITNGNGTNRTLRIDGENGDQVDMSAFSKGGVNSEGYREFSATSNGTTFTIEIKDEIVSHS
ncbi:retention module-containing protein [Campylobacter concisus]|uniref:retention module-containing protein n=1 Tax=Campylobacter concisus TaxID=199 RepID=UPI000D30B3B6|nr:retention module-containing protein [Campylobacter concisus]